MNGTGPHVVDRDESINWFRETRRRTAGLFGLLIPEAYYDQPIPLRHPVVFYEGHIPAFSVNTLLKRGLGRQGLDDDLELLFARGIDPEDRSSAARLFLVSIRAALRIDDRLVLGTDLVKTESELVAAYDDPLGVTAAFNKNLLVRLNRELGANFTLDGFAHRAVWNAAESRVEMHLESLRAQRVSIPRSGCEVAFAAGESIWTESSYKYERTGLVGWGADLGLARHDQWVDEEAGFAVTAFDAVGFRPGSSPS